MQCLLVFRTVWDLGEMSDFWLQTVVDELHKLIKYLSKSTDTPVNYYSGKKCCNVYLRKKEMHLFFISLSIKSKNYWSINHVYLFSNCIHHALFKKEEKQLVVTLLGKLCRHTIFISIIKKLGAPVHPVQKVSLEPCSLSCTNGYMQMYLSTFKHLT